MKDLEGFKDALIKVMDAYNIDTFVFIGVCDGGVLTVRDAKDRASL